MRHVSKAPEGCAQNRRGVQAGHGVSRRIWHSQPLRGPRHLPKPPAQALPGTRSPQQDPDPGLPESTGPPSSPGRPLHAAHTWDPQRARGTLGHKPGPQAGPRRTGVDAVASPWARGLATPSLPHVLQVLPTRVSQRPCRGPQLQRGQGPPQAPTGTGTPTAIETASPWAISSPLWAFQVTSTKWE